MTANNENANSVPDSLAATIEQGIATILDPTLSLQGYAAYPLRRLAGMMPSIHPANRSKAEQLAREYVNVVTVPLAEQNTEGVKKLRAEYTNKILYGGLTQAPPEPSQWEIWRFRADASDWRIPDFQSLLRQLQPNERIIAIDSKAATISSGRKITREDIWLLSKPASDAATPNHIWLAQRRMV